MGTGRVGRQSTATTCAAVPATCATAANRSARWQARRPAIAAPFDMPKTYTRRGSTGVRAIASSTSAVEIADVVGHAEPMVRGEPAVVPDAVDRIGDGKHETHRFGERGEADDPVEPRSPATPAMELQHQRARSRRSAGRDDEAVGPLATLERAG